MKQMTVNRLFGKGLGHIAPSFQGPKKDVFKTFCFFYSTDCFKRLVKFLSIGTGV